MYKLLVVEDEDFIRETIVSCIDWKSIGFVVEQAEDGEIALEVAQRFRPDAVVTDVRMPIMDGLELTAALKKQFPETVVVVLSGHDEFKYAQEAMSLGVAEYITKPILPKDFTDAMRRLYTRLSGNEKQRMEIEKLQLQLHQSLPLLRERLLNLLITRPLKEDALAEKLGFLELDIQGAAFTVLVFSTYEEDCSLETGELITFALLNVISEEIGNRGICFNDSSGRLVVLFCANDPENEDREFIYALADALRLSNQYVLNFTITAAIGATVHALSELSLSYETAISSLEQQLLFGKGRVYDYRDYIHMEPEDFYFFSQVEELITCFHFNSNAEFIQKLADLTLAMTQRSGLTNPESIRVALIDLLNGTHRVLLEAGCALPPNASAMYERIFSMDVLTESVPLIKEYLTQAKEQLDNLNTPRSAAIIQMVCTYIKQSFSDPELSLNRAAEQVFISPVYLSMLFKRELGVTFVDYVTATRLEQAKKHLQGGRSKNYEVAAMVGYNDPQYFSNCFKKYTGMTPSEYRAKRR